MLFWSCCCCYHIDIFCWWVVSICIIIAQYEKASAGVRKKTVNGNLLHKENVDKEPQKFKKRQSKTENIEK